MKADTSRELIVKPINAATIDGVVPLITNAPPNIQSLAAERSRGYA